MISSKTKFCLLVTGHIVGDLLLAWMTYHGSFMATVGLFAFLYAQAGLLGIWAAMSTNRLHWRFCGVCATTALLYVLAITAQQNWFLWSMIWDDYIVMIALPPAVIFLVLSGLRYGRRKLCLAHSMALSPTSERFQFSIQHLLLATVVVAVVLAIGRGVRAFTDTESNVFVVSFAILVPWIIMVDLASLWAALGIEQPMRRLAVVIPAAFVVGPISIYYRASVIPVPTDWKVYAYESALFGIQAIITAASLLVIRSCGWRLVGGRDQIEPLPTPPGS